MGPEKLSLQVVKGGEKLQGAPLALQTFDHGQWQKSRTYGTLLPSDTLQAALVREGFDPSSRTAYLNPHTGTRVEFYTKPGSRPGEYLAFVRVAPSRHGEVPPAYYLPNDESVVKLIADWELEMEGAVAKRSEAAA